AGPRQPPQLAEPLSAWVKALLEFRALWTTWQALDVCDRRETLPDFQTRKALELLKARVDLEPGRYGRLHVHELLAHDVLPDLPPPWRSVHVGLVLDADHHPVHADSLRPIPPG